MVAFGVLIVDDNHLFLEGARERLEQGGLRVVGVAANSAEAVRRTRELRPDVVLVDVMLGDESGIELARLLAADALEGRPAVILISTYSAADLADPDAESLVTGFLPKQELSASAIRRIVYATAPSGPARRFRLTFAPAQSAAVRPRRLHRRRLRAGRNPDVQCRSVAARAEDRNRSAEGLDSVSEPDDA